jgi:trehalose-phosphatase
VNREKHILLFLDYDGTLADIVEDPGRAFLTPKTRDVIGKLCDKYPTAIVTGRSVQAITTFLEQLPSQLALATCHGHEMFVPPSTWFRVGEPLIAQLQSLKQLIIDSILPEGALLEDNTYPVRSRYPQQNSRRSGLSIRRISSSY